MRTRTLRSGGFGRRTARIPLTAAVAAALACGLAGCDPTPATTGAAPVPPSSASPTPTESQPTASPTPSDAPILFLAVVDGDTVTTSAGTVRLIGIDTPERGECGYDEASMVIGRLIASGAPVTLESPPGENDRDAHDRLLRYVITADGVDLGLAQLEAGNAIARYDSTDGYPAHPREADYRAAQVAGAAADGSPIPTVCQAAPLVDPTPAAPEPTPTDTPWYQKYSSCSKLKKNTVGDPKGPFDMDDPDEVEIYNWFQYGTGHRGDGDGDGLACE